MPRRILTVAVAALLMLATAADAKKPSARLAPKKIDPGACVQMRLFAQQLPGGPTRVQVLVAEACRGDLYADLHIEVNRQEVEAAHIAGASYFVYETELAPSGEPLLLCAWLEGELVERKLSVPVYRSECTILWPPELEMP